MLITEYLKPIFGFTLKRCKSLQDAEDLSQEIIMKAFRTLLIRDNIRDTDKFIWTIAHHSLSNYYRDTEKYGIGVPLDEFSDMIADPDLDFFKEDDSAALKRMLSEIAYLSKLQRKIVIAYYFENRKQAEIANELKIPVGTVKWHLFEAKKDLKRGMNTMRKTSELKFNPIKFENYGINGSVGTKSPDEFFRSALSQNICYSVRNTAKTISEIADDLGVSPVYVESEIEFLEQYGFLTVQKDKYLVNFIIEEPTAEFLILKDKMYKESTEIFANALYDELMSSGILEDDNILCGQASEPLTMTSGGKTDKNYLLWALIPYIAARSGEKLMAQSITFDEVATHRPDGAHNIYHAAVLPSTMTLPEDYVYMENWCGPMWNGNDHRMVWQINSKWSDRKMNGVLYASEANRVLSLYEREADGPLSKDEYAWLAEQGYIKTCGEYDGHFKTAWQLIALQGKEINERLLKIGEKLKESYKETLDALKAPYVKALLDATPDHLKKITVYESQYIFYSDGWFLLHCIMTLLRNGKLKEPTEGQRKALTTLLIFS